MVMTVTTVLFGLVVRSSSMPTLMMTDERPERKNDASQRRRRRRSRNDAASRRATKPGLPDEPIAATALMTRAIEEQIRRCPEQWVWFHRRWRHQPADPDALPSIETPPERRRD